MPKLVEGLDLRTLPIGPEEAFVLSRVDGRTRRSDIVLATGIDPMRVNAILDRLLELGAIAFPADAVQTSLIPPPAGAVGPQPAPSPQIRLGQESSAPDARQSSAPPLSPSYASSPEIATPSYDPRELEEPVDLPPERRRQVLDLYHRLGRLSHYEVLGVAPAADKQAIKSAYFELVTLVHPDRYFGKNLGSYKQKLEKLFERVTLAHDTLTKKKSRAEYDEYLESRQATRALERAAETTVTESELAAIERQIREEALRAAADEPAPRAATPPGGVRRSSIPTMSRPPPPGTSRPPMSPEERRKSLVRKLGIGPDMPPRSSQPAMSISQEMVREAAAEDLKRRYEARVAQATQERLRRYIDQADQAEAEKNLVAAANALRIAQSLAPEDEALAKRFRRVEQASDTALARQYLEQAQYEERTGNFADAARHYERAARGSHSPSHLERAAHCYLEAGGDLRHASDLAKRAVELAPKQSSYRITLARIYAQAGMTQSAIAELERARTLDPDNDSIKDWLKRVKRA